MGIPALYGFVFLWLWMCLLPTSLTIDYPCPVGAPCDCDGRNINCDSRGLTEVPHFNLTNGTYWWLDLSNNSIDQIPSQAFANLKGMDYLKLSDNHIQSIADDALLGSETSLTFMVMRNNKLRTLPLAISKMKALVTLIVEGNPLQNLDSNVLKAIGPILDYFSFGSPEMTQWPTGLQYLTRLTSLTIRNSPMRQWPSYAFLGLNKVELFSIENCMIQSIPVTLNMMTNLDILSLDSNSDLPITGIPNVAFSGLSLSTLDIRNQSYHTLPNIFYDAINLNRIDISMTPITNIPASLIPDNTPMTELELSDTGLNRIPDALPKMKRLRQIIIRYSNITTISSFHFQGFTNLSYLGIFYSPLSEIADDAFADMNSLQWLFLDNTNMTTVPKALLQLKNPQTLRLVSLEENRVVCNCESLSWLKEWGSRQTVQIAGSCANIRMDLPTYIIQEVPKCP